MSTERDDRHRTSRMNLAVRDDQKAAIEHLAVEADLTLGQVVRRLLDLGLAHWSTRVEDLKEAEGVAS